MVGAARIEPLRDEEYVRVMFLAKRGGPDDPAEIESYQILRDRLHALTVSDERERTAYHAAAQTVVAHALLCPVAEVIVHDDGTGYTEWSIVMNSSPTPQERLRELLAFSTISASGYVAEQMRWRYARAPEPPLVEKVLGKFREFYETVRPVPGDVREALAFIKGQSISGAAAAVVEHQEAVAETILRENWPIVERLAQAVQAQGSLTGVQLQHALAGVTVVGPEGLLVTSEN